MSNSINTNIAAFFAQANITAASAAAQSSVARLSSGNRIVQASDDVAALATGTSLASQVSALKTAQTNASQGTSLLQVADGALAQIGSILQQQRSLALQAGSGSLTNVDRGFLNQQFQALTNEINSLAASTTFNGVQLIDGSIASAGSANALQDVTLDAANAAVTSAGTTNTTNGPSVGTVNYSGFTDTSGTGTRAVAGVHYGIATNGETQYTGFAASALGTGGAGFSGTVIVNQPAGTNDANLTGNLSNGGHANFNNGNTNAITVTFNNTTKDHDISATFNGVVYTGTISGNGAAATGTGVASQPVTLSSVTAGTGTISLALNATAYAAYGSGAAVATAIQTDLQAVFATAIGFNPYFTNTPVISQPAGANDTALYGNLANGTLSVAATKDAAGAGSGAGGAYVTTGITFTGAGASAAKGYVVSYGLNGVTYQGYLATTGTGAGNVTAASTVTLTALTNPASHAQITLTVGDKNIGGATTTVDESSNILAGITNVLTGSTGYSAGFTDNTNAAGLISQGSAIDSALYGDLSQGSINIYASSTGSQGVAGTAATVGASGNAKGYTIQYTLNGRTYTGFLANHNGAANGHGAVAAGATVVLGDGNAAHGTINLKVGTEGFGETSGSVIVTDTADQSANIKAGLAAYLTNATAFKATNSATLTGLVAQTGIGNAVAYNNVGTNDTALVGDLSTGVFNVTGNTTNGYSVSYALNGSTYQGSLNASEILNGGNLVLSNGNGSIAFTITGTSAAGGNANIATAATLKTALTAQFAAGNAYAVHKLASTLATDSNGATIAGSAITAASTTGTLLNSFTGANATLQSALFSGVNAPSIATFSGTGIQSNTVLSVVINGTTYSTHGGVTETSAPSGYQVKAIAFDGNAQDTNAGIITFYANGDSTSNEKLTLNLSGISATANLNTSGAVTAFTDALNAAFGAGGSSGGLTFQLGTTSTSTVSVAIGSARTTALFAGQALDISTQAGANAAATSVGVALDSVTSLRAGVGALESQFSFAAAALQTSVQNQDAARGQFLDTDITTESTAFATSQVKLQAGISVLAQANQQLQALLKLIG